MTHTKTMARLVAAVLVAGGMAIGVVAPASAATQRTQHIQHGTFKVSPHDTGWNGT